MSQPLSISGQASTKRQLLTRARKHCGSLIPETLRARRLWALSVGPQNKVQET